MINCEKCGDAISVIDSRVTAANYAQVGVITRRRRSCKNCGHRYTTFEVTEKVVKELIANSAKLQMLGDILSGRGDFHKIPKLNSLPKAIEYFGEKK